jgi:hypothetical protein
LNKGRVHFVVVFNLTRFARDKYDHFALRLHLQSLGISLRSATEPIDDTSTGKLMEGVLAAFAQFDNDVRSDRTRAGMKGCAGARAMGVPGADRVLERAAANGQEPDPRSRTGASGATCVRGVRDGPKHEGITAQARQNVGPHEPAGQAAHVAGDRHVAAQPIRRIVDVPRHSRRSVTQSAASRRRGRRRI